MTSFRCRATVAVVATTAAIGLTACSSTTQRIVGADCTAQYSFPTVKHRVLTIVGPDYPPIFTYQNHNVGGVDGAVLREFAKASCLDITIRLLPTASVIEAVKGGQSDIAAGAWYATAERAKVVNQTEPVYADPAMIVTKHPSPDIEKYKGKTIGIVQGMLWTTDLQRWNGSDNVKLYSGQDALFQDLARGRVDVAIMAANEAAYRIANAPAGTGITAVRMTPTPTIPTSLNEATSNYPHTKGNDQLTAALNDYVAKIRADGELASILESEHIDPAFARPAPKN